MAVGAAQREGENRWGFVVDYFTHSQRQEGRRLVSSMVKQEGIGDTPATPHGSRRRRLAGIQEAMGEMGAWKPGWRSVLGEVRPHLWVVPGTPAIV
jgi:hypothetical protein